MNVKLRALRAELGTIVEQVHAQRKRVVIHRHHDPVAVIISMEEMRELDELRRVYTLRANARSVGSVSS